jgi:TPR repeat protein
MKRAILFCLTIFLLFTIDEVNGQQPRKTVPKKADSVSSQRAPQKRSQAVIVVVNPDSDYKDWVRRIRNNLVLLNFNVRTVLLSEAQGKNLNADLIIKFENYEGNWQTEDLTFRHSYNIEMPKLDRSTMLTYSVDMRNLRSPKDFQPFFSLLDDVIAWVKEYYKFSAVTDNAEKNGERLKSLQNGCDADNLSDCSSLADMYFKGEGIPQNLQKAITLYTKACERGNAAGCKGLALLYRVGVGVPKDSKRAAELYKKACDVGLASGCSNLGVLYENGEGVSYDQRQAIKLYHSACDQGDALGCLNLGVIYHNGDGVQKDLARAAEYSKKGCDGGESLGCFHLAQAYNNGEGVPENPEMTVRYMRKASDLGNSSAFQFIRALRGLAKNEQILQKQCSKGKSEDCKTLLLVKALKVSE